ncbi:MFS transporter [Rubrivivax gelatinosus]|uniref:MFS transporter n=1 Tax=Rubrivivax gelatinosus TaxID=28068 RepID=UPI0019087A22|nr:MFS transporter [Rubrivivax gelatinosus]MBK1612839.1 MFS transporter [Rubrivivax gelatinosus]
MNTVAAPARGPAAAPASAPGGREGGVAAGLRYGALGLPLAFVALPLYVLLPNHYASAYGVPLATLGALLLAVRLFDAVVDPFLGLVVDRLFAGSRARLLATAAGAAALLAVAFHGLFFPPVHAGAALLAWCAALLVAAYLGYSLLAVLHQAWGARLGGDAAGRARVVSWREGLALAGVLVASVLPSLAGLAVTSAVFAVALVLGLLLLAQAPRPLAALSAPRFDWRLPLATPAFRRLLAVYLVNGIASAVPATLVLFFVRDRLQAPAWEPVFLASYFAAGALAMPLWVRLVARLGLARSWLAGMALAVAAFVWAFSLGAGDTLAFTAVCVASGAALGADLALPAALLAGVVRAAGHTGREGAYFGWWNFATKLNLALAAGVALPLLGAFGYAPGVRTPEALGALAAAYCLLPCALKLAAGALLWRCRSRLHEETER